MRTLLSLLIVFVTPSLFADALDSPANDICLWMSSENFRGNLDYTQRNKGLYRCASSRKPINQGEPQGSNVRYVVDGTETAVSEVRLEMQMRAFKQPQRALKKFYDDVAVLTQKALGAELPDTAGNAIRSGIAGQWSVAGHTLTLKRIQDFGSSYDFYFSIR